MNEITVQDLQRKYGSLKDIPDAELSAIGMRKIEYQATAQIPKTFRVVPLSWEEAVPALRPVKPAIFRKLPMHVLVGEGRQVFYRILNALDLRWVRNKLRMIDDYFSDQVFIADRDASSSLHGREDLLGIGIRPVDIENCFKNRFSDVLYSAAKDPSLRDLSADLEQIYDIDPDYEIYENSLFGDCRSSLNELFDMVSDTGRLQIEEVKELHVGLQKIRSKIWDALQLDIADGATIKNFLNRGYPSDLKKRSEDTPLNRFFSQMNQRMFNHDHPSREEALCLWVRWYLEDHGLAEILPPIEQWMSYVQVLRFLENFQSADLPSGRVLKAVKSGFDRADQSQKAELSVLIKKAKADHKSEVQKIQSLVRFMRLHQICMEKAISDLDEVLDYLIRTVRSDKDGYECCLDGTPSEELDADPGALSGDCTEGRPLPFFLPNVHNVKYYDDDGRHAGNIYLFSLVSDDNLKKADEKEVTPKKIWHLDAIQIPESINIDSLIESIFRLLGEEAERQGVDCITVNNASHLVSNYDYIGAAVDRLISKRTAETEFILQAIEKIEIHVRSQEKFSEPQCTGEVRVVWKNPASKEAT